MKSVFQKFLLKELGKTKYLEYVACYQKLIRERKYEASKMDNREIFEDIYKKLHRADGEEIKGRLDRLVEAMQLSMQITKHYRIQLFFALAAMVVIAFLELVPFVALAAEGLIAVAVFYLTVQFLSNKFCFIDAHIVIVYKSVLDVLLLSHKARQMV